MTVLTLTAKTKVPPAAQGHWLAMLAKQSGGMTVVTSSEHQEALAAEIQYFSGLGIQSIAADQLSAFAGATRRAEKARSLGNSAAIVIVAAGALQEVIPVLSERQGRLKMISGEAATIDSIGAQLSDWGYVRVGRVGDSGDYCIRGGILDVWPTGAIAPVRIEFWGDRIDSLRTFDPSSQMSLRQVDSIEVLPERALFEQWQSVLSALQSRTFPLVSVEPGQIAAERRIHAQKRLIDEVTDENRPMLGAMPEIQDVDEFLAHSVSVVSGGGGAESAGYREILFASTVASKAVSPLQVRTHALQKQLDIHPRCALLLRDTRGMTGIRQLLEDHSIRCTYMQNLLEIEQTENRGLRGVLILTKGPQVGSFLTPDGTLIVSEAAFFGRGAVVKRHSADVRREPSASLANLKGGSLVVHKQYGLGRITGAKMVAVRGVKHEMLGLEYAEGGRLFLPMDRVGILEPYLGPEEADPPLDKIGSDAFARRVEKIKDDLAQFASDLLLTEARREIIEGIRFNAPGDIYQSVALGFEYELTADQEKVMAEVVADLTGERAMDRLLVGDVGYGKTEIALRAAAFAAENGQQTAILVPTTVLALQHYRVFSERLDPAGVSVEMVSRLRTPEQNKDVLRKVAEGKVDIVIGTHRLLQRDVHFKGLGLVVVDEEHRFGVAQKEKLRALRHRAHYLAMSATPIPRSMQMALGGVRGMSTISTAPPGRRAVQTTVAEFDEESFGAALRREYERGGQCFVVHNKIEELPDIAEMVKKVLPTARVDIGHGRLGATELEDLFIRFYKREIDVLISTTIIESGVDFPNANTLIVLDAGNFGLAELYQLRGRVGRSDRQAYVQLVLSEHTPKTEVARRRVEIVRSFQDLGSGFEVAMYDLEIRGAGDVLGKRQAGHIRSIGLHTYFSMLREAVEAAHGTVRYHAVEPEIQYGFEALIDPVQISDLGERVAAYQRLDLAADDGEVERVWYELGDRFGHHLGETSDRLRALSRIKWRARQIGIARVQFADTGIRIALDPSSPMDRRIVAGWLARNKPARLDGEMLVVPATGTPEENMAAVEKILEQWRGEAAKASASAKT